ncbi:MAG: DUF87 domain-containing protein [Thaumarchaeota archaeon]|nr:DUF87 domain-containing protein [Nitrososphaerota archaeon]
MSADPVSETTSTAVLNLGHDGRTPFTVDANLIATGRTCVLGSSGSGKSYAVGVICEELCRKKVPFALVDTEGEYSNLKEKFGVIWVGDDVGCDLRWDGINLQELAAQAPDIAPLILDVSDLENPREKIASLLTSLYSEISSRRTPYLVILEEADKFVPQAGQRVQIFDEIARRGRKRGLGLMLCSQRPSLVDKNVLSQCGNQLIGKLIIQNDLKSVSQFFPERGLPKQLTTLRPGMFYALGGLVASPTLLTVRKRESRHGGVTPILRDRVVKPYMGTLSTSSPFVRPVQRVGGPVVRGETKPGLPFRIKADDIPIYVKREKRFLLFGKDETVTSVQSIFHPLIEVGVRLRKGVIKKKFETFYITIDGISGKLADIEERLTLHEGFERLIGLSAFHLEVLRGVSTDSDSSVIDIASRVGDSKGSVRRVLNLLEEKRLVRSIEMRRNKLFRRLIDIPKVSWERSHLRLEDVEMGGARREEPKIKEKEVKDMIRGLWDGADLDSFNVVFYPVYKIELTLKRRRREVYLDGRTGKDLPI